MSRFIFSLGLVLTSFAWGAEEKSLRCGGEGPKPYIDVSANFSPRTDVIDTVGGVSEFVVLEKSNKIIYRNPRGDVRGLVLPLPNEFSHHYKLTQSTLPLSRLIDASETRILTEKEPFLYNTATDRWAQLYQGKNWKHLFWENVLLGESLYSVPDQADYGGSELAIYQHTLGPQSSKLLCRVNLEGEYGRYAIAEGARFPYIHLYRSEKAGTYYNVRMYSVDVRRCKIGTTYTYEGVRYPVQKVYKFPGNAALFKVEHPTENMLWWTGNGCQYYNGDGLDPIVLRQDVPTIALWSPYTGLNIIFLDGGRRAHLMDSMPFLEVGEKDLYMTSKGDRLFLAGRLVEEKVKWLFELKLPVYWPNDLARARQ